jgi:hypothetical protein
MGYPSRPVLRHNLPWQATSFVGRGAELAELRSLVRGGSRLITIGVADEQYEQAGRGLEANEAGLRDRDLVCYAIQAGIETVAPAS